MEAGQYQLQLAGIGVDVADAEDAGRLAFKTRRVHRDQILVQVDAEFRDGAQLDGQAEEGQERIGFMMPLALVGAGKRDAGELAGLAMDRLDAGDMELDLS